MVSKRVSLAWTAHWGTTERLEKYDTWLPIATSVKIGKENPDNIIYYLYIYIYICLYISIYIYIYTYVHWTVSAFFLNNNYYIDLVY